MDRQEARGLHRYWLDNIRYLCLRWESVCSAHQAGSWSRGWWKGSRQYVTYRNTRYQLGADLMTFTSLFYGDLLDFVGHVRMDLREGEASSVYSSFVILNRFSQIITTPPGFARDVGFPLNKRIPRPSKPHH